MLIDLESPHVMSCPRTYSDFKFLQFNTQKHLLMYTK